MPKVARKDDYNDTTDRSTRIRWRFTCWEQSDALKDRMLDFDENDTFIRYVIFSKELAPDHSEDNDGLHFQGYVELKIRKNWSYLKKRWGTEKTHYMRCDAPRNGNITYCSKDVTHIDGPWSNGELLYSEPNNQGKRTDILTVKDAIEAGYDREYCIDHFFEEYKKYHSFFDDLIEKKKPVYKGKVEKLVFYGAAGTGKTTKAYELFPNLYKVEKDTAGRPIFDTYNGEETVLINDFRGWKSGWKFDTFLNFAEDDSFGGTLPARYKNKKNLIKRIIFTTPVHPEEWFTNDKDSTSVNEDVNAQVMRRIDKLLDFTHVFEQSKKKLVRMSIEDYVDSLRCVEVDCNNVNESTSATPTNDLDEELFN